MSKEQHQQRTLKDRWVNNHCLYESNTLETAVIHFTSSTQETQMCKCETALLALRMAVLSKQTACAMLSTATAS